MVAPCAGAWIEIYVTHYCIKNINVAPCAGAWIEIGNDFYDTTVLSSLPVRERGLKYSQHHQSYQKYPVAPCAGAWIEISNIKSSKAGS